MVPIEFEDVDNWLLGSKAEASKLIRLSPAAVIEAGPALSN